MKTPSLSLLLSILTLSFPLWAALPPKVELFEVVGGKKNPSRVQQKAKWTWIENAEKVKELRLRAMVKSPVFSGIQSIKSNAPGVRAVVKNGVLATQVSAVETRLDGTGSKNISVYLRYSAQPGTTVVDEGCRKQFGLALRSGKTPFFVGIRCEGGANNVVLTLSYPSDVSLFEASFPESKGQGKSWKQYQLGAVTPNSGDLGSFVFVYGDQSYPFTLVSGGKKGGSSGPSGEAEIYIGGGLSLPSIVGPDINRSSATGSLLARLPHYQIADGFGVSAFIDYALPIIQMNYFQAGAYAEYRFHLGDSFSITPKAGFVYTDQGESTTAISLNAGQPAFGASLRWDFMSGYFVELDAITAGYGVASVTGHYLVDFGLHQQPTDGWGWAVGLRMQSFSTHSSTAVNRDFSQMLFYGLIGF